MTTSTKDRLQKMLMRQGTKVNLVSFSDHREEDKNKRRSFTMNAYTGDEVGGFFGRLVIDLAGMRVESQRMPILRDHFASKIVGHSEEITISDKGVIISGLMSQVTADGVEVTELADEGFPWQASIGFQPLSFEEVMAGTEVEVNGRTFQGPIDIIRQSILKESSFVPLGADSDTESVVLSAQAPAAAFVKKERAMDKTSTTTAEPTAEQQQKLRDAGSEEVKGQLAALKAKYGEEDPAFVLEMFEAGNTMEQAESAWQLRQIEKLTADNAELKTANEELKKKPEGTSTGTDPVTAGGPAGGGDMGFMERAQIISDEKKISMGESMRRLARAEPRLHFLYVEEAKRAAIERDSKSRRGSE